MITPRCCTNMMNWFLDEDCNDWRLSLFLKHIINNAETTPNNETVITGKVNTPNDSPTAGGILSPRLIR